MFFGPAPHVLHPPRKSRHINALHGPEDEAYSPPVAHMAIGFGDPEDDMQKLSACLQALVHPQGCFMAAVRGRPSGLPVTIPGSPTCVQLPPFRLATIER